MLLVRGLCLSSLLIATGIIGFVAEQGESMSSRSSTAPRQLPASKLSAERVTEHPKVAAEILPHESPAFPDGCMSILTPGWSLQPLPAHDNELLAARRNGGPTGSSAESID